MITLPPYGISYQHFTELTNGHYINMEVYVLFSILSLVYACMYFYIRARHSFFQCITVTCMHTYIILPCSWLIST